MAIQYDIWGFAYEDTDPYMAAYYAQFAAPDPVVTLFANNFYAQAVHTALKTKYPNGNTALETISDWIMGVTSQYLFRDPVSGYVFDYNDPFALLYPGSPSYAPDVFALIEPSMQQRIRAHVSGQMEAARQNAESNAEYHNQLQTAAVVIGTVFVGAAAWAVTAGAVAAEGGAVALTAGESAAVAVGEGVALTDVVAVELTGVASVSESAITEVLAAQYAAEGAAAIQAAELTGMTGFTETTASGLELTELIEIANAAPVPPVDVPPVPSPMEVPGIKLPSLTDLAKAATNKLVQELQQKDKPNAPAMPTRTTQPRFPEYRLEPGEGLSDDKAVGIAAVAALLFMLTKGN